MEKFFYRGVNIFIPENLSAEERDSYIRSSKSSISRWRPNGKRPRRRRNV
tara:strand:+ start:291 stop:440 length:150 start_codon:yes stop_codon:yes gene_type:complete